MLKSLEENSLQFFVMITVAFSRTSSYSSGQNASVIIYIGMF